MNDARAARYSGEDESRRSRSPQPSRIQSERPSLGGRLRHSVSDSMIQQRLSDIRQQQVVDVRPQREIDELSQPRIVRPQNNDLVGQRQERFIVEDRVGSRKVTQRMPSCSPELDDKRSSNRHQLRMRDYSPELEDERAIRLAGPRQGPGRTERPEMLGRNNETANVKFQQTTHSTQAR